MLVAAAPTLSALERQYPKSARIPSIEGLPSSIDLYHFDPKPVLPLEVEEAERSEIDE
jgi:hypothetical protein